MVVHRYIQAKQSGIMCCRCLEYVMFIIAMWLEYGIVLASITKNKTRGK